MKPPFKDDCRCYTIPIGKAFVNTLADWLLETHGQALSRVLVLLPTRRACRSLRDAFLERSGGRPLLLPRIQPIGDGDEAFTAAYPDTDEPILPAIDPLCRQLLLTRLVQAFKPKQAESQAEGYNLEQSARLAKQLSQLLDDAAREEIPLETLDALVEGELAVHWQQTLEFLTIISKQWPHILEAEGCSDPVQHQNQLLHAMAHIWRTHPPSHPVIAAGITGSQPATIALLTAIAELPKGMLILPSLDLCMPKDEWEMLGETHPQYALKRLLDAMQYPRGNVGVLGDAPPQTDREQCLRTIFMPPAATMYWPSAELPLATGMAGVRLLAAETQFDEARMVATALREALETPAKTAALVTPDRTLARMVAAQMRRFGITIDDSGGKPLRDTPAATFMRFVLDMVSSEAAPVPLLCLLRHPLAACSMEPASCRLAARNLETDMLRGIRFTPGLDALCDKAKSDTGLFALLDTLRTHTRPLSKLLSSGKPVVMKALLAAHIECAQQLASTHDQHGETRLWAGEAGNAMATFLAQLMEHADRLEPIDPSGYGGLLDTLMAGQVYRPRHGLHPRLHILGPMEARLQHFDLVILGGLNEGTWPSSPDADPWMSRPMRSQFGLSSPEFAIGMAAHDVFQFCMAPQVILTRAKKVEGKPTVPSRWLVRLHTLVSGLDTDCHKQLQAEPYYTQALQWMDAPLAIPALQAPAPSPPVSARPRKLRVTAIDRWLRDPYVIYAQYILGLKKLAPLDEEPDNARFGTLVHAALEHFCKRWPDRLPPDPHAVLLECGRQAFADFIDRPAVACLWWPRFENIAGWIIGCETQRRTPGMQVLAETKGEWQITVNGTAFTLTTSIDRIERYADGNAIIVDYKTGSIPEKKDFIRGTANQLPLEALIIRNGTLAPPPHPPVQSISAAEYWKLGSSSEQSEINLFSRYAEQGIDQWLEETRQRLEALILRFDDSNEPYAAQVNPALRLAYNDYEQLARYSEWEAA